MPQPVLRDGNIAVVGLGDRPEHAAKLGMIVALSAGLESQLGYLLALLSGGNPSMTMTLFQAVASSPAQRAMLSAAAKRRLKQPEFEEFTALMEEFRERYRERSYLVHNLWGTSEAQPDLAVLCPAPAVAAYHAAMMDGDEGEEGLRITAAFSLREQCRTYKVQDLQDVIDRMSNFIGRLGEFNAKLASRHPVLGFEPRTSAGE